MLPHVAIVGRANVGKSTLFNRITKKRSAIVNDTPGVTRDRLYLPVEGYRTPFILVDTGGLDRDPENEIEIQVKTQGDIAIAEADAILFVADRTGGLTPQDHEVIAKVRQSGTPLFLAVNKVDHPSHEADVHEFTRTGVDHVYAISAEHGLGVEDLMQDLVEALPQAPEPEDIPGVRVAVIGRPNVGKSSLVNRLMDEDRCIVSEQAGTTRDTTDTPIMHDGKPYVLIDTAGIRRKGKTHDVLEKFSVIMALKALERCDIAVLMLDSDHGVSDQDATIAGYAFERGRGVILVANKWDLTGNRGSRREFEERVRNKLKFLEFAPIIAVSAKTGLGLRRFFPLVDKVFEEYTRTIPTSKLNTCFEQAVEQNPLSGRRGKFFKVYYSTQVKNRPPTFQCFVNFPDRVHFSYQRYLTNQLRHSFGFQGTPVRLIFTNRHAGKGQ